MSLEGSLEDLAICDILQIISLSKKSGTLRLSNKADEGAINFLEGQVSRAVSSRFPANLGVLLCRKQFATKQQIEDALARQKAEEYHRPIGAILAEMLEIPKDMIEFEVRQQIEAIVLDFFDWPSGTFEFQLEEPIRYGRARLNPLDFMLEQRIAPQWFVEKEQHKSLDLQSTTAEESHDTDVDLEKHVGEQHLDRLRGMLVELETQSLNGGIILMILRYASEFLTRAIIFDVRGHQLVGIGQFGLDNLADSADETVRKMRFKAMPESLFGQALQQQSTLCGSLGELSDERLVGETLGDLADESFVGSLVSDGKVVALLYADNYPQRGPIQCAHAFEVFLAQAGATMEQMLQEL